MKSFLVFFFLFFNIAILQYHLYCKILYGEYYIYIIVYICIIIVIIINYYYFQILLLNYYY